MCKRIPLLTLIPWIAFLFLVAAGAQEQSDGSEEGLSLREGISLGTGEGPRNFSLLDPEKFSLSHHYTLSYFTDGRTSASLGLYQTSLEYQLSSPLTVRLDLGYLHRPPLLTSSSSLSEGHSLLSAMELRYRPNDNVLIQINVGRIPRWSHRRAFDGAD